MKTARAPFLAASLMAAGAVFFAQPSVADGHGDRHAEHFRGEIRAFHRHDWGLWKAGHWEHGFHDSRYGWWWLAGGEWYFYPAPVFPYPNPYEPSFAVINPSAQPAPTLPPQPQNWYHCSSPTGYYPYVTSCPGGWQAVPATPGKPPTAGALSPQPPSEGGAP
jgi:hypothetical protein